MTDPIPKHRRPPSPPDAWYQGKRVAGPSRRRPEPYEMSFASFARWFTSWPDTEFRRAAFLSWRNAKRKANSPGRTLRCYFVELWGEHLIEAEANGAELLPHIVEEARQLGVNLKQFSVEASRAD